MLEDPGWSEVTPFRAGRCLKPIGEAGAPSGYLRGDVTIFCGVWFSVHNFTILQYFPLIKVSYCSSFKELSIDVLTLYVAYLLFMLQVQTVSWVKKTY